MKYNIIIIICVLSLTAVLSSIYDALDVVPSGGTAVITLIQDINNSGSPYLINNAKKITVVSTANRSITKAGGRFGFYGTGIWL